jgi:hypothetical protein
MVNEDNTGLTQQIFDATAAGPVMRAGGSTDVTDLKTQGKLPLLAVVQMTSCRGCTTKIPYL